MMICAAGNSFLFIRFGSLPILAVVVVFFLFNAKNPFRRHFVLPVFCLQYCDGCWRCRRCREAIILLVFLHLLVFSLHFLCYPIFFFRIQLCLVKYVSNLNLVIRFLLCACVVAFVIQFLMMRRLSRRPILCLLTLFYSRFFCHSLLFAR